MMLSVGISTVIENLKRVKRQIKRLVDLERPNGMEWCRGFSGCTE